MLSLQQILEANDTDAEVVNVPEWGGDVAVYPLTVEGQSAMRRWRRENPDGNGYEEHLLMLTLRDLDLDQTTAKQLRGKSAAAVERLVKVAERLASPSLLAAKKNSESNKNDGS